MEKMIGLPIFVLALIIEIYAFPPPSSLLPPTHVLASLIKFRLTDLSRENDSAQDAPQKGSSVASSTCPKTLSSITDSKNGNFYLFKDDSVWTLNNRTVISGPKKISQVFPNGPDYVNATVTSRDLTVLLEERTLYGYNQDEVTGEFKVAKGFPAKLHELVLFFPVAAFPLSNGSIILLSHFNAFATYNLFDNRPSLLNDKDVFFPGLPKDLASGIPENRVSDDFYMLFTKNQVYKYDNRLGEIVHAQPLSSYLVCPIPLPLLGNGLSMARTSDIYNLFNQWSKTYGPVHTFWFGETPIVAVTDYKIIEKTFIKDGDNYAGRPMDPFGTFLRKGMKGVIVTEGHLWQDQRRFALQTLRDFGFGKNIMQERILDEVSSMLANIKNDIKSGVNEHNITTYIDVAVGSIINALLFGYRFEGEKLPEFYELKQLINNFLKLLSKPHIFVMRTKLEWFQHIPIFDKIYFESKNFRDKIFDFLEHQVKEHIAEIDHNSEPIDFVDAYLRKKAKNDEEGEEHYYSMDQLLATILDLWLAGQETTSSTLSKGVVYLIQNQDAQKKLHEELDRVVGNSRLVTLEDRPKLHYTLAVVNEIQRLANIVAINVHHTTLTDVEIQGYKIPKGTIIIPHISAVMSDSKAFPDPEKFNPERYLDEKGQLKKVDELVPFSVGKRQCLGESLARMELYLFVANIFNQFKISEVSEKPPEITRNFVGTFAAPTFTCVIENRF